VTTEPPATLCCVTPPPASLGSTGAINLDEATIGEHLDQLQVIADDNNGTRAVGTNGYEASADYVERQLTNLGYDVSRSEVDFTAFTENTPTTITIGSQSWSSPEWLTAMIYSGSGDITATAETVGIQNGQPTANGACSFGEWSNFHAGDIALVMGGPCIRRDIATLANAAGAAALISLYPQWGANQVLQPTLIDPSGIDIPVIAAGAEPAAALLTASSAGTEVTVHVDTTSTPAKAESVIADLSGATDTIVMLGGHLDSVLAGPGINDNGSGVATLLALAAALKEQPTPTTNIRFAFWAAEELGDVGSRQYVAALPQEDIANMRAYLNLDMVASPNAGLFVYDDLNNSSQSSAISQQLIDALAARGYSSLRTDTGGASDHASFQDFGVPVGGVFSGISPLSSDEAQMFGGVANQPADPCYHLACDTRANTDTQTAVILGNAVADVLMEMAY